MRPLEQCVFALTIDRSRTQPHRPVLLRGAMPPAGIVQQVPHWPMITQGTSGEQSNPTAAGTPPGAVQVTAGGASAAVGQAAVRFASGGFVVMAHRV